MSSGIGIGLGLAFGGVADPYPEVGANGVVLDFAGLRSGGRPYYRSAQTIKSAFTDLPGATYTGAVSGTGATVRYASTAAGLLVPFANNVPRVTDLGYLAEEARTNSIRNSTATNGSVAGTPGTAPTNWSYSVNGNGLSRQIVGAGTDATTGLPYIDFRLYGTTTGSQGITISFEGGTQIAASNGQVWTESAWLALVGGSVANLVSMTFTMDLNNSGGSYLSNPVGTSFKTSLTATPARISSSLTVNNASTAYVKPYIIMETNGVGLAIDFTLRVIAPQHELGSFATSYIPTTSAAVTRSADASTVAFTGSPALATISYGTASTATVSNPTSPFNFGSSSGGAWVNNYVRRIVIQ